MNLHNLIQDDKTFNIDLWRQILNDTASTIGGTELYLEVITPFGFEVTHDNSFLKRHLKRFYCYIGSANTFQQPSDELVTAFFNELYSQIKTIDPQFASEIILFIIESDSHFKLSLKHSNYRPKWNDKVISFEHRLYEQDLLTDYSDYLIATLWGFQDKTLPELSRFNESESVRCRLFQLYLILECLFGSSVKSMSTLEKEIYQRIHSMKSVSLDYYFTGKTIQHPSEEAEQSFDVINSRLQQIFEQVKPNTGSHEVVRKSVKSYNSKAMLHFDIDFELYNKTVNTIKESYRSFQNTIV